MQSLVNELARSFVNPEAIVRKMKALVKYGEYLSARDMATRFNERWKKPQLHRNTAGNYMRMHGVDRKFNPGTRTYMYRLK